MKKGINVLSLFDGMRCGRIALERAGIEVNKYYSSEIDKYAMQVADKNYPQDIPYKLGDVTKLTDEQLELLDIDLLIGGSPCQSFSFAGKMNGMTTKDKVEITNLKHYLELKNNGFEFEGQSYLFWEYMRVLNIVKPKYFLLENVKMSKKWKDVLDNVMGVSGMIIDSELVSAQNRIRLYWTNIQNVKTPKNLSIYLESILESNLDTFFPKNHKEYLNYDKNKVNKSKVKINPIQIGNSKNFGNAVRNTQKAYTLRAVQCNGILDENFKIRKFSPIECERLQTVPDNYTEGVSNTQRYKMLGNGWTVDVIAHIFKGLKGDNIGFKN